MGDSVRDDKKNKSDKECNIKCNMEQQSAIHGRRNGAR